MAARPVTTVNKKTEEIEDYIDMQTKFSAYEGSEP